MERLSDLHRHLDGSLSMQTVRRLAGRAHIALPEGDGALAPVLRAPADCDSLDMYLRCFDLPVRCMQSAENLFDAAYSAVSDGAMEGLAYLELRFAPLLHIEEGLSCSDVIENVVNGVKTAAGDFGVTAGVIVCGMRHMAVSDNMDMLRKAVKFFDPETVGMVWAADIAGGEADYPTMVQAPLFEEAVKMNIPFTIHAGECGSAVNVADAVKLGARRIGHGIALMHDREGMAYCRDLGVTLEMCPTSNIQTKAVTDFAQYPLPLFLEQGLKVTINTDNCTVSNTNIHKELELVRKSFGLSGETMKKLLDNSISSRFYKGRMIK